MPLCLSYGSKSPLAVIAGQRLCLLAHLQLGCFVRCCDLCLFDLVDALVLILLQPVNSSLNCECVSSCTVGYKGSWRMLTSTSLLDGESGALAVEAHVDELF